VIPISNSLNLLQVGEFFPSAFSCVADEHHGQLGVFAVASRIRMVLRVLTVVDALAFFQTCRAVGSGDPWRDETESGLACACLAAKSGDVIDGVRRRCCCRFCFRDGSMG